jgi:glycosyltransferase involved in cell wall biosynthesis
MDISIIICTRNRAESLAQTLDSFKSVEVPRGTSAEILVVDNASTDQTREVTRNQKLANFSLRYLSEEHPGKMWAQNRGVAAAQGTVILTTDDDVRPAKNWLEKISGPLLARECDVTVGRVLLSDELRRPWMTEHYRSCVAWYEGPPKQALDLIGANMGFHRCVLERVPAFDTETGPGALGFCDDTLFGLQLAEAGFRLRFVPEASVVHYADPSRLLRRHCLSNSQRFGASLAYLLHHWRHEKLAAPRLHYYYLAAKLIVRRMVQPPPSLDAEGTPPWEASYVAGMAQCRQFLLERRRPRNYSKRGLTKLAGHSPSV